MYYVFGDCTLDTQRYELRRCGVRSPLRRKVFQVLVYLIEQRDRVVTRDEVLAQVWPDQYVGEKTLTSCVKVVRRAVGDSGRAQWVIQTVHGHGLRFVADVTVTNAPLAPISVPAPAPPLASACPVPGLLVGDATQARMLRELAEALEILTTEQPLLLVLEDLHWSDTATLEWLAYVARRRDPARLLVLATYRPAEARVAAHPGEALVQDL